MSNPGFLKHVLRVTPHAYRAAAGRARLFWRSGGRRVTFVLGKGKKPLFMKSFDPRAILVAAAWEAADWSARKYGPRVVAAVKAWWSPASSDPAGQPA